MLHLNVCLGINSHTACINFIGQMVDFENNEEKQEGEH